MTIESPRKIAYVQAGWHQEITDGCKESFFEEIARHGHAAADIEIFTVPGSLEIPLVAKRLAESRRFAAICASGLVVDGGIYRHEFVAQAVLNGIVQVSLETGVPVLSAVLTPQHFQEHEAHLRFFKEHMHVKGAELGSACAAMIKTLATLPGAEG
ncbi:MAG: 6,7-dimethyl-8-ribityllumazine synthase [Dehalococcoidia bacterium]|nr:6,7-dimethyl-8-ribityllumazine synthase [Dehalococcoidia bacterium]